MLGQWILISAWSLGGCLVHTPPASESPARPAVQILEPRDGYLIPSPSVTVVVDVEGATLARDGMHLHVAVDGGLPQEAYAAMPLALPELADGRHTVEVVLAGPDHRAVASATSTFVIERKAVAPREAPRRPSAPGAD